MLKSHARIISICIFLQLPKLSEVEEDIHVEQSITKPSQPPKTEFKKTKTRRIINQKIPNEVLKESKSTVKHLIYSNFY